MESLKEAGRQEAVTQSLNKGRGLIGTEAKSKESKVGDGEAPQSGI